MSKNPLQRFVTEEGDLVILKTAKPKTAKPKKAKPTSGTKKNVTKGLLQKLTAKKDSVR